MMMQMLEAGGLPILKDDIRSPDDDNPKGYYEFERVKQIADDQAWLEEAQGRAVKMVSALLMKLPPAFTYKIIFMRRQMEEILRSQRVMLHRRQQPSDKVGDDKMAVFFQHHLKQVETWLAAQPHAQVLYVNYNEMLKDPRLQVARIDQFLDLGLDRMKMVGVVDHRLYRERHSGSTAGDQT
jgi:sulfotransferase family protein